jgi:hypothetical protein
LQNIAVIGVSAEYEKFVTIRGKRTEMASRESEERLRLAAQARRGLMVGHRTMT